MSITKKLAVFVLICFVCSLNLLGQTISEKLRGVQQEKDFDETTEKQLQMVNEELQTCRGRLEDLNGNIRELYSSDAEDGCYSDLLKEINNTKKQIWNLEKEWQRSVSSQGEDYGLWYQPETTIGQLVIDYGAQDYVYLVSPEIADMKISVSSHLPIPRESWVAMLEVILAQNGIGVKLVNPFLRQLYLFSHDNANIQYLTDRKESLLMWPEDVRVGFLLKPSISDPQTTLQFLENFSAVNQTTFHIIGNDILVVSTVHALKELLKLHDFVEEHRSTKNYKVATLKKISAKDMAAILTSLFTSKDKEKATTNFNVLELESISRAVLLMGTKDDIEYAENLIQELEEQIEDSKERIVFWYTVKHSDAEELAEVLGNVYNMIIVQKATQDALGNNTETTSETITKETTLPIDPVPVVVDEDKKTKKRNNTSNFIVDTKTGSIIMVVEQAVLPQIQRLLKKIDVPKKMVNIEVLLCEKRITDTNSFGINLLKLGTGASSTNYTNINFKDNKPDSTKSGGSTSTTQGLLEFLIGRKKHGWLPSFKLAYNFLITQEDIQINANPSVTTINQTPASIDLMDEISINTGVVEIPSGGDVITKDAYERKQYGIHINITPVIHMASQHSDDEDNNFITLKTDIVFDTQKSTAKTTRPTIFRRQIKNEVRIADGQTVILGGLRQKDLQDSKESIPFLGEIPGVGKVFSNTGMSDSTTEMFIFITPKIIEDPVEQLEKIQTEELRRRPGDIPEYLERLVEARQNERQRLFEAGMKMLFGRLNEQSAF